MKLHLKDYKSSIILISSLILGILIGLIFNEQTKYLEPFANLFISMINIIAIPFIFFNTIVTTTKIKFTKRTNEILKSMTIVFISTAILATIVGITSTYNISLLNNNDANIIKETTSLSQKVSDRDINFFGNVIDIMTVNELSEYLVKENITAILILAIIIGLALTITKENTETTLKVLVNCQELTNKLLKYIMYYAPIGIATYFAVVISNNNQLFTTGYFSFFIVYLFVSITYYAVISSANAFLASGKKSIKDFWLNNIHPSIVSLTTSSSLMSMKSSILSTKKIGVSDDTSEITINLGTIIHKEGTIIANIFKIMFISNLLGISLTSPTDLMIIALVAIITSILYVPIPFGNVISDTMILTMTGYSITILPVLIIISVITSPIENLINNTGNITSSMLISRLVDGENWQSK